MKPALDAGADVYESQALIRQAIGIKPLERPLPAAAPVAEEAMSILGG